MPGKLKVVAVGAHPDDPESACGGTLALLAQAGHEVVSVYLTRGEAGIPGASHTEAARIRTAEAERACEILKVRPAFLGQIDGSCEVNADRYADVYRLLASEAPDMVLTHWPVDAHRDHRACSMLVYDAWVRLGRKAALYYFEVVLGLQSQLFHPTDYVDIEPVLATKHAACFIHESQKIREVWAEDHGLMEQMRGLEAGCQVAEAFVHHVQSPKRLSSVGIV
jgi:LmbE family N-acetylglucosaminyl deacetylase